ncbi:hypothetical protein SAMN04487941_2206 [Pontibacter akesuensis]|uniref:Uncharacterized protein n=1 Tax=Pontibacter akesuensis TaxID=388950 RepID=A0A1I7IH25_9BACT|nr:hypothetical protein SAMN04487941_2206 [Pontibacter akesuensis]
MQGLVPKVRLGKTYCLCCTPNCCRSSIELCLKLPLPTAIILRVLAQDFRVVSYYGVGFVTRLACKAILAQRWLYLLQPYLLFHCFRNFSQAILSSYCSSSSSQIPIVSFLALERSRPRGLVIGHRAGSFSLLASLRNPASAGPKNSHRRSTQGLKSVQLAKAVPMQLKPSPPLKGVGGCLHNCR